MPHETIIKYQCKGFWIDQEFLEVLSQYICEAFENTGLETFSYNLIEVYDDCDYNRKGENIGVVNILLDGYIITQDEKNTICNVLENAKAIIQSKGDELSPDTLNQFENKKSHIYYRNKWGTPIKTQSLVATLNIMQQLINGVLQKDLTSVYYIGFNNPDGVTEI